MHVRFKQHSVLPGFGLTLGMTLAYLGIIVLIPLSLLVINTMSLSFEGFIKTVTSPRVMASYKLSFGASLLAAAINAVFGFIVAWTLVRYEFPGKRLLDAIVDLPFAMPTAISGIALTTIYAPNGWIGSWFAKAGIQIAYTWIGVLIALIFIGLPFVVRTLQPTLEDLDIEIEEAAASLGATRFQTFWRVIFPSVLPSLATGFTLALARAIGEYGSVVFISGNLIMKTEITPLIIVTKLEDYDYPGATAIAVVMLLVSFVLMFFINLSQWYARRFR